MWAENQRQAFLGEAMEIPELAEVHEALYSAVKRVAEGKRPFGLFGGDKPAKSLFEQIRVRSTVPANTEQWQRVLGYLDFARKVRNLRV
jgi:hypothetical protein